jgi:hypothetical protein
VESQHLRCKAVTDLMAPLGTGALLDVLSGAQKTELELRLLQTVIVSVHGGVATLLSPAPTGSGNSWKILPLIWSSIAYTLPSSAHS